MPQYLSLPVCEYAALAIPREKGKTTHQSGQPRRGTPAKAENVPQSRKIGKKHQQSLEIPVVAVRQLLFSAALAYLFWVATPFHLELTRTRCSSSKGIPSFNRLPVHRNLRCKRSHPIAWILENGEAIISSRLICPNPCHDLAWNAGFQPSSPWGLGLGMHSGGAGNESPVLGSMPLSPSGHIILFLFSYWTCICDVRND